LNTSDTLLGKAIVPSSSIPTVTYATTHSKTNYVWKGINSYIDNQVIICGIQKPGGKLGLGTLFITSAQSLEQDNKSIYVVNIKVPNSAALCSTTALHSVEFNYNPNSQTPYTLVLVGEYVSTTDNNSYGFIFKNSYTNLKAIMNRDFFKNKMDYTVHLQYTGTSTPSGTPSTQARSVAHDLVVGNTTITNDDGTTTINSWYYNQSQTDSHPLPITLSNDNQPPLNNITVASIVYNEKNDYTMVGSGISPSSGNTVAFIIDVTLDNTTNTLIYHRYKEFIYTTQISNISATKITQFRGVSKTKNPHVYTICGVTGTNVNPGSGFICEAIRSADNSFIINQSSIQNINVATSLVHYSQTTCANIYNNYVVGVTEKYGSEQNPAPTTSCFQALVVDWLSA
jgi:hypothetical protein